MYDKAVVTKITNQNVVVVPLITDACLSCSTGCAKRGRPFSVINKQGLPIKTGSIVKIQASPAKQALQGITALVFPVCCSIVGYCISPTIATALKISSSEGFRAGCVLLFLAVSSVTVFLLSRGNIHVSKPEITEIC